MPNECYREMVKSKQDRGLSPGWMLASLLCMLAFGGTGNGKTEAAEAMEVPQTVGADALAVASSFQGDERYSFLEEHISQARTKDERFYWEQVLRYSIARDKGAIEEVASVRDALLSFAADSKGSVYGARALTIAGDMEQNSLGMPELARGHLREATALFESHPEWDSSKNYAPYTYIRIGDSFRDEGRYEEAADVWEDGFAKHANCDFSLQIPQKVHWAFQKYLPPEEAHKNAVAFYDKALRLRTEPQGKGRLLVQRLWAMKELTACGGCDPDRVIIEIRAVLDSCPPGKNIFVDRMRENLIHMMEEIQAKFPTLANEATAVAFVPSVFEEEAEEDGAEYVGHIEASMAQKVPASHGPEKIRTAVGGQAYCAVGLGTILFLGASLIFYRLYKARSV